MGLKVEITETHFGHKEGDILDYVGSGTDHLIGDYIVAKDDKSNERVVVKMSKCKILKEEDVKYEKVDIKENDVFQLKISMKDCNRSYYRAYRVESDKIIFFSDQGKKISVNKRDVNLVDLDSLFDAFTNLELEFNQMKRWLQRIFNDNVVKMLDN